MHVYLRASIHRWCPYSTSALFQRYKLGLTMLVGAKTTAIINHYFIYFIGLGKRQTRRKVGTQSHWI